jgi:hypothetical protein
VSHLLARFALLASLFPAPALAAPYTGNDLFSLGGVGNGITRVNPTGYIPAGGGAVGGQGVHGDNFAHAYFWSSSTAVDLNPAPFTNSSIYAANASHQVGYAANSNGAAGHAFLWSGTAASAVDLTPAGYLGVAYAASDTHQVGSISGPTTGNLDHAVLWAGNADSYIDINPAGMTSSRAFGLDATHQVGSGGGSVTGNAEHALLWTNGASAVDLHPAGFAASQAHTVHDGREVGIGYLSLGGNPHALLWNGASPDAVDLTPAFAAGAVAYGVDAASVVGYTISSFNVQHAAYWSDSAASYIDLHALLPAGFISSQAYDIAADGTIYGTALDINNVYHSVSWTPVPEPASLALFLVTAPLLARRRRLA